MLTGLVSGHLQQWLGYQNFFMLVMIAALPSLLLVWLAPFGQKPVKN